MDKKTAQKFREFFQTDEFKALAEKHMGTEVNVEVDKSVKYDNNSTFAKITFAYGGVTPSQSEWDIYCFRYGFEPKDFGTKFEDPNTGVHYRICGVAPRSHKYPILAEDLKSGKTFKFPARAVRNFLGKEAGA